MTATAGLDFFARSVRERLFAPGPSDRRFVGLEIELLPLLDGSGLPCPLETSGGEPRSTLAFLRPYGAARGWRERQSTKGAPYFALPNGAMLTFEPGGQLELCTPATSSISSLLRESCGVLSGLRTAAADAGITLMSAGIDPNNEIERVPLQLHSPRYREMTRYFDGIGPFGVRMMRQTAATQVSLDAGTDPEQRWRLLSDLTPALTAIFANSSHYAGHETGYRSFRARCWRLLDPSRTGVPHPELRAAEAYTRFALDAVDMTRTDPDGNYRPFSAWASEGDWSEAQWGNHLTTLFPEVRPRGHLEVRCIDAVESAATAAAVTLITGIAYDREAAEEARSVLPAADEDMLNEAARLGLTDTATAETAAVLVEIGLRGARALGEDVISGADCERAAAFFADWTLRRRSPADVRQAPG